MTHLKTLPEKLSHKLVLAGYDTVEKMWRASDAELRRKVHRLGPVGLAEVRRLCEDILGTPKAESYAIDSVKIQRLAEVIYQSGFFPDFHNRTKRVYDDFDPRRYVTLKDKEASIRSIYVTMLRAIEAGIPPIQGLHNICYFNNRPCVWGDVAFAMVCAHPDFYSQSFTFAGEKFSKDWTCTFRMIRARKGEPELVTEQDYTWEKVVALSLDRKPHYQADPERMLMIRARALCMRDLFADVLCGLSIAEEQRDVEETIKEREEKIKAAPISDDPFTQEALEGKDEKHDIIEIMKRPAR